MMIKPQQILKDLQTFITLEDGDIVMTGTPKGVGKIMSDDSFVGQIYLNTLAIVSINTQLIKALINWVLIETMASVFK